jgi:hypothetical protein
MLVEDGETTWMFFTGVRDRNESTTGSDWLPRWQVLGAAYTTDPELEQWIRLPWPVWSPCSQYGLPGVGWALCNATQPRGTADFRDPHVLPPLAGSGDPWLLFFTARPRTDQFNYVVGVAQAPGPLGPWSDLGALWDTYAPPLNSKIESPHVFRRGTDWHLMYTADEDLTGIAWHTSHGSPVGPWTVQPSLLTILKDSKDHPYEFELEPEAWYAREYFSQPTPSGPVEYLAVVHSYDATTEYNPPPPAPGDDVSIIEFRRMNWTADGSFTLQGPNPVRSMAVSEPRVEAGEAIELSLASEGGNGRIADLVADVLAGEEVFSVPPAEVGLPATVSLTDPVTVVPWTLPALNFGSPVVVRIRVASQPLRAEATVTVTGPPGDPDRAPGPPIRRARPGTAAALGLIAEGTAGGPKIRLDLPAAGRARIALYDVLGRHVRTLVDEPVAAGRSSWTWDRRDAAGRPVAPGLYFARLDSPFGARTARVISVR